MSSKTLKQKPIGLKAKFTFFINDWLVPKISRVGNQTHLSVIRNSFSILTPLIFAGAFAIFLNQIILGDTKSSLAYWIAIWSGYEQKDLLIFTGVEGQIINGLKTVGGVIYSATYLIIALYIAFLIGYFLAKHRNQEPAIITGLTTLIVFFVSGGIFVYYNLPVSIGTKFLGAEGIFSAIIIAFLSGELLLWLFRSEKLAFYMPENVPETVKQSFSKLLPMLIVIFIFAIASQICISFTIEQTVIKNFNQLFLLEKNSDTIKTIAKSWDGDFFYVVYTKESNQLFSQTSRVLLTSQQLSLLRSIEFLTFTGEGHNMWSSYLPEFDNYSLLNLDFKSLNLVAIIYKFFSYPFMNAVSNRHVGLGLAIVYVLFIQLFWFFGLHGANIMNGIFSPVWLYALAQNTSAVISGNTPQYIFNEAFFTGFIFLGGWGMSLSLLLVTFLMGRDKKARIISKIAIAPAIFNINEPVTFSYPLILNPVMFIPAVFGPVLLVIWSWIWMVYGYVPLASLKVPWITPIGAGGFIATASWKGIILAVSNLILGMIFYIPFVLLANKIAKNHNNTVKLKYLGAIHYFFTGKNFQDVRYQDIKKRQLNEHQILRANNASSEERNRLREKHLHEWEIYRRFLTKERKRLRQEKQRNKLLRFEKLKKEKVANQAIKEKNRQIKKSTKKTNYELKKSKQAANKAIRKTNKKQKSKK